MTDQKTVDEQLALIKRGAVEIVSEEELRRKLNASVTKGVPLRVKAGFDPTAPDLHLGHTVLLQKLHHFQELGHTVYFLIGDFTGCIGDPSGRSELRKVLTPQQIKENAATYARQVGTILDMSKTQVVYNSSWFTKMDVVELLRLTTHATVAQMLARADFKKRMEKDADISLLEFIYPLLQGYDSVELKADIELGGTDQIFNLLFGRQMQKDFGQEPQVVITMPLLEGTDGMQKMSKSYGNAIGINEAPKDIFGKIMSLSDELMYTYYTLLTDVNLDEVRRMHPKEAKLDLAERMVIRYHSRDAASAERVEFERVFAQKDIPQDLPVFVLKGPIALIELMVSTGLAPSRNEARRLIAQGSVSLEGKTFTDENVSVTAPGILKVGKRRFLKVR